MLVKCQICQKKIERDDAYRITTISKESGKKTNKYYCSEEEFLTEQSRKKKIQDDQDRVYKLCCDIFGYKVHNSQFFTEWHMWKDLKTNEIIAQYLQDNIEFLKDICQRDFDNEYSKIRYFSAFLKNSLYDYKPKPIEEIKVVPKVVVEEYHETKYKPKARQALLDFEEDCDE